MSMEEDIELRDLLTQTLESNGCLAKIRAQLRASIFLALDEDVNISKQRPLLNDKLVSIQSQSIGKTLFCLVREFLEFFDLKYTASVYDSESYLDTGGYEYDGRDKLIRDLGIGGLEDATVEPLLLQILRIAQRNSQPSLPPDPPKSEEKSKTANNKSTSPNSEHFNYFKDDSLMSDVVETAENSRTDDCDVKSDLERSSNFDDDNKSSINPEVPRVTMNATFNVGQPKFDQTDHSISVNDAGISETIASPLTSPGGAGAGANASGSDKDDTGKDDTYEGTSSIAEDDHSQSSDNDGRNSIIGGNIINNKTDNGDNDKTADDSDDKVIAARAANSDNNVSSLSQLPPLDRNKNSRFGELPKFTLDNEKKKKVNLSDIDKMFDLQVDYEEDFVSASGTGSDVDLKGDASLSGTGSVNGSGHGNNNRTSIGTDVNIRDCSKDLNNSEFVLSQK